jgi:hypothetical protein
MALIDCYECNKQISDAAPSCPQCGAPKKEKKITPSGPDGKFTESDIDKLVDRVMAGGGINLPNTKPKCPLCGGNLSPMSSIEGVFRGGIAGAVKRHRCGNCGHMP